jgi:hypothetical protein
MSITSSRPPSASSSARPRSGVATERPFSASNLLATIANARFKSFQVQHDVLGKNPILVAIAREIPWKNLFDLFTLKFFAAGDELLAQGDHVHELVFVLCGGFLARRLSDEPPHTSHSVSELIHTKKKRAIISERMFKPGAALLVYPAERNDPLPYSLLAAKFKSIALTLPIGKFRSIWRQVTPETRESVKQTAREDERALVLALGLPIRGEDAVYGGSLWRRGESSDATLVSSSGSRPSGAVSDRESPRKATTALSKASSAAAVTQAAPPDKYKHVLRHSASTPVVVDATVTWSTLQTAKPAEYMVNSSLLILHERPATTGATPSTSFTPNTNNPRSSGKPKLPRSSPSAVVSAKAKKHTQRRLQSIKMPSAVEAFPRRQWAGIDLDDVGTEEGDESEDGGSRRQWESLSLEAIEQLIGKQAVLGGGSRALDVVPRVRVGRLLKPLKKPAMLMDEEDGSHHEDRAKRRDRRVLVADREEPFRDEAYTL